MTPIAVAGALVTATLRGMRRDRSAVVFLGILPVALMVLMGNVYASEDGSVPSLAVHLESDGDFSDLLVQSLSTSGYVEVVPVADRAELDDAVRRRWVDAGLVVDAGGSTTVVGPPQVQLPGGIRFVVSGAADRADRAVAVATTTGRPVREVAAALPPPVTAPAEDAGEARDEAAVGVLVLVSFMNLIAFSSIVPAHRALGVLDRLRVVPAGRNAVLASYATTFAAVAAVQIAVSLLAGWLVVGVRWGPPLPVVAVAAALAVAAGGVATVAATLLPTPESGTTIGGPVGFALGMLGGCLWPLSFVGGPLEAIGQWVPHQWAVASLSELAAGDATAGRVVVHVTALAAVGALGAAAGSRRLASSWG